MKYNVLTGSVLSGCLTQMLNEHQARLLADPATRKVTGEILQQDAILKAAVSADPGEALAEGAEERATTLDVEADHLVHMIKDGCGVARRGALIRQPPDTARADAIDKLERTVLPEGYSHTRKPKLKAASEAVINVASVSEAQLELGETLLADDTHVTALIKRYGLRSEEILAAMNTSANAGALSSESPSTKAARESLVKLLGRLERLLPESDLSATEQARVLALFEREITDQLARSAANRAARAAAAPVVEEAASPES